jgi:hypothetical protein
MRLLRLILMVLLTLGAVSLAHCASYMVRPPGACPNNGDGSTWGCAASSGAAGAYIGLPTLVRGNLYYLADGFYGNSLTLNVADSGTSTIELRKAQTYDHGSATGWNASTMGAAQAYWNWASAGPIVNISNDYWIINGNGNNAGTNEVGCGGVQANPGANQTAPAPNPAACGILIDDSTCTATSNNGCDNGNGVIHGGGHDIAWESVEWRGQGLNSNGNNNSETYLWFASGGNLTNDQILHSYLHNLSTTAFTVVSGGWNNGLFDHNYVWGVHDGSVNHGEAIQLQGSNGQTTIDTISNNIFRDQQTNGDVVAVITGTETFKFYNNTDFCSSGGTSTTCRHNDGVIGCFNSQTCSGVLQYDNTYSFPSNCGWNISGGPSTMTSYNNLYYACASVGMSGGTVTGDYNAYLNSSQTAVGAHDTSSASSPNPFTNLAGGSVALGSTNSLWNSRLSLGSPYDAADLYGNAFSAGSAGTRGAAQYVTLPQAATPTFSPAAGTYVGTQAVAIASTSGGAILCWNMTGSPATNGTTGCAAGSIYSGPVAVSVSETLYAVAGGAGYTDSAVASAAYTINPATVGVKLRGL